MAAKIYDKIPIVDTARRCGLVLDSRTLRRKEVEASCPFCGDHGPGKYHLSLNTDTDQYRCNLCGAHGNSVSLYARIKGICNKEAYLELAHESKVYPLPQSPSPQTQERQPCSLEQRHAVYSDMLAHLTLLPKHGENLLERGLSEERIRRNEYRSMPETERGRRLLADLLRSHGHDLHGNLFRISQTEEKLRKDQVSTSDAATAVHYAVGNEVREAIRKIDGTMPEDLPTPEKSIAQLEREQMERLKQKAIDGQLMLDE